MRILFNIVQLLILLVPLVLIFVVIPIMVIRYFVWRLRNEKKKALSWSLSSSPAPIQED